MVQGVMAGESIFFEECITVNTEARIHVMYTNVKPWMKILARNLHYPFQQVGATAHNSDKTQMWLSECLMKFWPRVLPSAQYCNPRSHFLYSICQREVRRYPRSTKTLLSTNITEEMPSLHRALVSNEFKKFHSSLGEVGRAESGLPM